MRGDRETCCKLSHYDKPKDQGKEASKENRQGNKCKSIIYVCQQNYQCNSSHDFGSWNVEELQRQQQQ